MWGNLLVIRVRVRMGMFEWWEDIYTCYISIEISLGSCCNALTMSVATAMTRALSVSPGAGTSVV